MRQQAAIRFEEIFPSATCAIHLDAALEYAERGWPVFPLAPNSKIPFKDSNGFKGATMDRDQIIAWWTAQPEANIGIRTGQYSGILAIDVDPKNGGDVSLAELERVFGPMPDTLTASTPSGGRHYILKYSTTFTIGSRNHAVAPGIDVKADSGYIVAAPSTVNGRSYAWSGSGIAKATGWLLGRLFSSASSSAAQKACLVQQEEMNLDKIKTISYLGSLPLLDALQQPLTSELVDNAYRDQAMRLRIALTLMTISDSKKGRLNSGEKVSVRSPLREDKHPSGGLMVATSGRLVFTDFAEDRSYSLPALRAATAYGKPKEELNLGKPAYFVWALRLLYEAGLITPATVDDLPPGPGLPGNISSICS